MPRYRVLLEGHARYELEVEADSEPDALHQAVVDLEDSGVEIEEIYSSNVEEIVKSTAVIPVVEMAALVPNIEEDFKKVRALLQEPGNQAIPGELVIRVLDYAERAIPIRLDAESREYFEMQKGDYIHYWGAFTDDDTTIETHEGETVTLPPDWIDKGLRVLAGLHYYRLHELLSGDYDSETLDALVQAAVFGELVYG